jgi:hypothetical protein
MSGSVIRWLRVTLPPTWAIVAALLLLSFWEGLYLWLRLWVDWPDAFASGVLQPRDGFAAMIMAAYGFYRVAAFHPLFRPKYRGWLEQSPWNSRKRLPLGPIHLVWQDALIVGLFLACLHGTPWGRVWALVAFLMAYLVSLGVTFWITGPWWMGYVVLFGIGVAVRLANWPFVFVGILMSLYPIAFIGRSMALARFPWQESKFLEDWNRTFRANSAARRKSLLGWPFGQLNGVQPDRRIHRRDGAMGPLLAAWWLYVIASAIPGEERGMVLLVLCFYPAGGAFLMWLGAYIAPCRPPISFRGRIMTGRWIIPGYDYVLLAPLCTLLVAFSGWLAVYLAGPAQWTPILVPLTAMGTLLVALNLGPSLGEWRLTGHHRIVPVGGPKDPQQVKL